MGTIQPLNLESPAALAHRLRCAWWRLPAGDWCVERGVLGVRHGATFTAVAQMPDSAEQRFGAALVDVLEGLPALLDLVAPMPPERPTGKPGSKYRKHQDRLIEEQAQQILALREELSALQRHMKESGRSLGSENPATDRGSIRHATASSSDEHCEEERDRLQRELHQAAREEAMLRELVRALLRLSSY